MANFCFIEVIYIKVKLFIYFLKFSQYFKDKITLKIDFIVFIWLEFFMNL